ncbi:hypothetical protein V2J09_018690 [Rumex salicifolius]
MASKSRILVIGGTGYIGKFIVEASANNGHQTFALVRGSTVSSPAKAPIVDKFKTLGVNLVNGDLYDHESLVKAIKQVDVVISTVGYAALADQVKIIAAIKEAGNVKRFLPSEFGNDVDRVHAVEPAKSTFGVKAGIRRAIEAEGIPFTYVSSNFFAGYFLPSLSQPGATSPPRDKVVILGDGNPKAVYNKEEDIATYTIRAVDDPRTLNKILYVRPPGNTYSFNDLVSLWEKKIGKTIEREYVPEEQVLKNIQDSPPPTNVVLSIGHSTFVKGDQTNFEIEESFGVEASEIYPDVKYFTVDEYLDQFVILIIGGTGYIGNFIVEASANSGHPSFALVRESTISSPTKASIADKFKTLGVNLIKIPRGQSGQGKWLRSRNQLRQSLAISNCSHSLFLAGGFVRPREPGEGDQAGGCGNIDRRIRRPRRSSQDNRQQSKKPIKSLRFLPSEFGNDVDRVHAVEPAKSMFGVKAGIRRAIEAEGIPFTYLGASSPPRDKVVILGDGNPKAVYNKEEDTATYTIRAVDDPRTLNKILYIRPPGYTYSFNDLVSLWEKKIGKNIDREYVSEEQVLKNIQDSPPPTNLILSIRHSAYVKGDHTNFEIDELFRVEASEIFPDVNYFTVDEYLDQFV